MRFIGALSLAAFKAEKHSSQKTTISAAPMYSLESAEAQPQGRPQFAQ
jgi:hypothetical protein